MLKQLRQISKAQKMRMMAIVAIVGFAIGTTHIALGATTSTTTQNFVGSGLVLAAFVVAGIEWSVAGYASAWRAHKELIKIGNGATDPNWKGFEFGKLKDDIFISTVIGVLGFMTSSITNYNIVDIPTFLAVVQSALGIIVPVDKIIVGAGLNR